MPFLVELTVDGTTWQAAGTYSDRASAEAAAAQIEAAGYYPPAQLQTWTRVVEIAALASDAAAAPTPPIDDDPLEAAVAIFHQTTRDPQHKSAGFAGIAAIRRRQGRLEEAISAYCDALRERDTMPESEAVALFLQLAETYLENDQCDPAIGQDDRVSARECLKWILERRPSHARAKALLRAMG